MKKTSVEGAEHPLLAREIISINSWGEWLERWEASHFLEELLGLLHVGFNVPLYYMIHGEAKRDYIDRIIFYLKVADGWADPFEMLRLSTDSDIEYQVGYDKNGNAIKKGISGLRQMLAEKAFDMLCLNFFRSDDWPDPQARGYFGYWERKIVDTKLFPAILYFFRMHDGRFGSSRVINLGFSGQFPDSHNRKHAVAFLKQLALFLWKWCETDVESYSDDKRKKEVQKQNAAMQRSINEGQLLMLEIFSQIGELQTLWAWKVELSGACLNKLEEIALRCSFSHCTDLVNKDRQVTSIDEACYLGSSAAWLLKRYELEKTVGRKLIEIMEAEDTKRQAEQKLASLTSK